MGALRPKFKAAVKSCVLVVIDQLHPFQNPQNNVAKHLPQFAEGGNVLNLIELLKSAFGLTRHSRRGDVEFGKANPLYCVMDLVNGRTPAQHRGCSIQFVPGALNGLFQIFTLIRICNARQQSLQLRGRGRWISLHRQDQFFSELTHDALQNREIPKDL